MKIGDEIYVHGYVDEIRNGTIIIRNEGGYFGTAPDEVMPSAQPERKTGRWIQDAIAEKLGIWICSECKQPLELIDRYGNHHKVRYCPNCGAKMEVET